MRSVICGLPPPPPPLIISLNFYFLISEHIAYRDISIISYCDCQIRDTQPLPPLPILTLIIEVKLTLSSHSTLFPRYVTDIVLRLPNFVRTNPNFVTCKKEVIVVEKERLARRADREGVFLITVDFSDNVTLFLLYIAVESYGYQKVVSLVWFTFIDGVALCLFVTNQRSIMATRMSRLGVTCMYRLYSLDPYVT